MNKNQLTTLTLVTLVTLFTCLPSYSKCSSRQLNKVCSTCQTQALNSSQCMSSCPSCPTTPACPTTTCPTCPKCPSCPTTTCPPDLDKIIKEAINDLRTTYTLSVSIKGSGIHNYILFITSVKDEFLSGSFSYSASYLNTGQQFNAVGLISGATLHFMLPAVASGTFFPLDCFAAIDIGGGGGITLGLCTSIQQISFSDLSFIGGELSGR